MNSSCVLAPHGVNFVLISFYLTLEQKCPKPGFHALGAPAQHDLDTGEVLRLALSPGTGMDAVTQHPSGIQPPSFQHLAV